MRAGEVLDAQGDLLERLSIPMFTRVIDALGEFEFGRSGGIRHQNTDLSRMLKTSVPASYAFRVTHDMSLLVEHAAAGLDDLDRFDHSLAPTGCGFVAFDRPLPLVDMRGKTMLVHYLVWGPIAAHFEGAPGHTMRSATLVVAFNDTWRQPDQVQEGFYDGVEAEYTEIHGAKRAREIIEEHQHAMGRWATVGASAYLDDQRLGPMQVMPDAVAQAKILAEGDTPQAGTSMLRYVHALWLMMEQTVAKVEEEEVDRTSRRRAERRKIPSKVTVIRLRREQGAAREPGESTIEWAHRWVVRGHWRWQAVSERHPLAQEIEPGKHRARIWINPFVKGPDGAPFVQSQKVYSLER